MSTVQRRAKGRLRRRLAPSFAVFVIVAGGIYVTSYVALAVLRHVVMPILAVSVAGYLAVHVYRFLGHRED